MVLAPWQGLGKISIVYRGLPGSTVFRENEGRSLFQEVGFGEFLHGPDDCLGALLPEAFGVDAPVHLVDDARADERHLHLRGGLHDEPEVLEVVLHLEARLQVPPQQLRPVVRPAPPDTAAKAFSRSTPAFDANIRASATASMFSPTSIWLQSFTVCPMPWPPTWVMVWFSPSPGRGGGTP